MRLAPFNPFLILRHLFISPLLVCVVPFPSHHPRATCHASHSPSTMCLLYLISYPLPLISSHHVFSPVTFLTPHHLILHPHSFDVTTPFMRPILCAGLHAYPLSCSTNPGGSTKGLPHCRSVELAGPSSIPMKQLLKQLVVVRHRLRHNGKVRFRIKGTSLHSQSCQKVLLRLPKLHDHSKIAAADCQKPCRRNAFNATSQFCCYC